MKNKFDTERILQAFIILTCLFILTLRFSSVDSNAQSACLPNQPPIFRATASNPLAGAWAKNKTVSVVIFDRSTTQPTSTAEADAINTGITDWNAVKVLGCSNVTFLPATLAGAPYDGDLDSVATDSMYVIRTTERDGELDRDFYNGPRGGVRAALLYMHSRFDHTNTTNLGSRVDNLARHEAGHSFGIGNGDVLVRQTYTHRLHLR